MSSFPSATITRLNPRIGAILGLPVCLSPRDAANRLAILGLDYELDRWISQEKAPSI
jgi:hypothetical protein